MILSSTFAPCGLPGVSAISRTAASRFSRPQQANAPAQFPGLSLMGDSTEPARTACTPGSPATSPAIADPPLAVSPYGPSPPDSSDPIPSANDRCRCAPLPAPPGNATGENDTPRPCRVATRPISTLA